MGTKLGLRLALASLLALAACSGDDDEPAPSDAGARDAASSGGEGTGSGKEGLECNSNADCASGLSCLRADERVADLKVCARPCEDADDCEDSERCLTVTKDPADSLCWNIEGEALELCGPGHTALCDETKNLGCLRVEDEQESIAAGVCLSPCELGKEDACAIGFVCLDILEDEKQGLCAKTSARGEICDEPQGKFCEPGDLCLSDKVEWRCYQDCSESNTCDDEKECKAFEDEEGGYCE